MLVSISENVFDPNVSLQNVTEGNPSSLDVDYTKNVSVLVKAISKGTTVTPFLKVSVLNDQAV